MCSSPEREKVVNTETFYSSYHIIAKAFICKGGKYLEVVCALGPLMLGGTFIACSSHTGSSLMIPQTGVSCISFFFFFSRFYLLI